MTIDLARVLGKHIVGFSWYDTLPDKSKPRDPRLWCTSGFVVSIRDYWFLVTAGHILKDYEQLLKTGEILLLYYSFSIYIQSDVRI